MPRAVQVGGVLTVAQPIGGERGGRVADPPSGLAGDHEEARQQWAVGVRQAAVGGAVGVELRVPPRGPQASVARMKRLLVRTSSPTGPQTSSSQPCEYGCGELHARISMDSSSCRVQYWVPLLYRMPSRLSVLGA